MARASTETLLPLDTWAAIMGLSPLWFNQIGAGFDNQNNSAQCEHVFYQYSWQNNFMSREEIAKCIGMAEDMIADQLGFYPAPKYTAGERHDYPRPYNQETLGYSGRNARGQSKAVQVYRHKVLGGGVLLRTPIERAAAVVLSDADGDGVTDTFTVTVPTTVTDTAEIAAYFVSADRLAAPLDETWRVRPIRVAIASGNVTVTGSSTLIVRPPLTFGTNPADLNVNDAIYATTLEIHRVCRDDSTQGIAVWETYCSCTPCETIYTPLCLGARNAEIGFVSIEYALSGVVCPGPEPDRVILNYLSGVPLVNGQMDRQYADIVAHLATALLPGDKCGCERAERTLAYWREVAPAGGEGLRDALVGDFGTNPFGPQRGAVYAWHQVYRLQQQT